MSGRKNILCQFGIHKWKYIGRDDDNRYCERCNKGMEKHLHWGETGKPKWHSHREKRTFKEKAIEWLKWFLTWDPEDHLWI